MRRLAPLLAAVSILACGGAGSRPPVVPETTPADRGRTLFVAVDAVRFDLVEALMRENEDALFEGLKGPARVISSFPSSTTLAFTGILEPFGLERPPGYEAKFYDWSENRLRGGGLRSYKKIAFSWRDFFDWKTEGILAKAIGYGGPVSFGRREIRNAMDAFLASDKVQFFAYITATDALAHLKGDEAMTHFLRNLDLELQRARVLETFRVVVFSDHGVGGGEKLRNSREEVLRSLSEAGFRRRGTVSGRADVVIAPFGLLSSLVVFAHEDSVEDVSRTVGRSPGVELCAGRLGPERVLLAGGSFDRSTEAVLRRRERAGQVEWRYRPVSGDPLQVADWGLSSPNQRSWWSDEAVFEGSARHRFPDAAHRIFRAFDLVENPASVICSVAPGWMFGPRLTDLSGRVTVGQIRWTHGALDRDDSLGFFVTDHPDWQAQDYLRFDSMLRDFAPSRVAGESRGTAATKTAAGAVD